MIKVLLNGCLGAMGLVISELIEKINDMEIVAGIDRKCKGADFTPKYTYAVYESPSDVKEEADVCIDFSSALAVDGLSSAINVSNFSSTTFLSTIILKLLKTKRYVRNRR